jgi:Tfp pilus assembly protein PilP
MMRRIAIAALAGGVLTFWIAGGIGSALSGADEVKKDSPAASQSYRYRTVGKPDPFQSFIETDLERIRKEEGLSNQGRPISPLQQKEVGAFRLVGIAGDDKKRTAVVEDGTAKKIYTLFVGTYIGLNQGRVAEILPDRVIVEERAEAKKAKNAQIRRITMMLHKEE